MTYEDLKQHWKLRKEVQGLVKRIEGFETAPSKIVSDSVKGSSHNITAHEAIFTITGLDQRSRMKREKLVEILQERKGHLDDSLLEVERFISSVDCSKIRQIIDLHIRQGLSWNATASRVYDRPCGCTARKYLKRYLEKNIP